MKGRKLKEREPEREINFSLTSKAQETHPIGTIKLACDIGRKTNKKMIWLPCPTCQRGRWLPVHERGRYQYCRRCRHLGNTEEGSRLAADRHRYIVALGKAAEEAGWKLTPQGKLCRKEEGNG